MFNKITRITGKIFITGIIVCAVIVVYAAGIEPNWIKIREQPVYISNLPYAFEGFRIILLSDLHGKKFSDNRLAVMVNKLHPDVIAITGDVLDQSERTPIEYVDKVFKGLTARHGLYFVFGNNDKDPDKQALKEKLAEINIRTLLNETVSISLKGETIDLIGIDDPYSMNADLVKALDGTGPEPKILLTHTPESINEAVKAGIDLVLTGHTHGGQISIPFIPPLITNVSEGYEQYISGLYTVGGTQMYVNPGLGENYLHVRFLTRPEITILTLYKKRF